jgi:glycosyltransferase involved in cell wall biosynthesis
MDAVNEEGALGPRITVGIPVHNGAATLRRAVESVLAQTYPVTAVHISDNASTDETAALAHELAARSPAVRVTSHRDNLGMSGNFGFVLERAETEYFMWLAADDYLEPTYVERLLEALEADPSLVACVSRARFLRGDGTTRLVTGTFPLMGDTVSNLAAYLSGPSDNTRIFGVYRTPALQAAFTPRYFHAYDWAVAAGTLLYGRHGEVPEILMVRDETPNAAYVRAVRRDNRTALGRLFPAAPMTGDLVQRQKIPLRLPVLKALLRINLELHLYYCLAFHPGYGRAIEPLLRKYVLWRLAAPQSAVAGDGRTGAAASQHAD